MEIIIGFNKHHSETCPICVQNRDEDVEPMTRRSIDLYECPECGLLVMAGYNAQKLRVREIVGRRIEDVQTFEYDDKVKPKI